jgi:glycosyltransferase involved in cell wall biosynthesis
MRAGRAVIATDIGGQSELLSGGGGLLVRPGDAVALGDAIGLLWRDRVSARGHGSAGREQFLRSYTAERHVDGLEAVYREAIALAADGGGQRRLRAGAST